MVFNELGAAPASDPCLLYTSGDAQCQHRQDDLLFRAQIVLAQAQDRLFAGEELQDPRLSLIHI